MKEPLLTDEAKNDLAEIWAVIADARDERTANRVHQKILASCRSKAQFPETGRLREEISPGLRSVAVRPYAAFFRPFEDTIVVLRILHGRRDLEQIMSGS